MASELLIAVSPGEVRGVLVEDGRAAEIRIERLGGGSRVGEIYLGRVVEVLPAMPAALIDIGLGRPALLSAEDAVDLAPEGKRAAGIAAWVHQGQAVAVQVTRDAQGGKAVGVTARLRIAGRLLELTPTRARIAVPPADGEAAPDGLVQALRERLPQGVGAVLRRPASAAGAAGVADEASVLAARWAELSRRLDRAAPPALLAGEDDPLARVLAAAGERRPARIAIDDRAAFAAARSWLAASAPDLLPALALDLGEDDLFERRGLGEEIAAAAARRVELPGGGALLIESVAAASLIDVDGGSAVRGRRGTGGEILAVNRVAAAEAARQIRLRNLCGAIIVDFIGVRRPGDRAAVGKAFAAALAGDPAAPNLLGWTRLGHVELTRRRAAAPLHEILGEPREEGGWRRSAWTIALEALRAGAREAARRHGRLGGMALHPDVALALREGEAAPARRAFERTLGRPLALRADRQRPRESFEFLAQDPT